MNKPRVLCMWDPAMAAEVFAPLDGIAELDLRGPDQAYLDSHLGDYDVYLAGLKVRLERDTVARGAAGRLRLVYTPSTGLDHLDVEALAEHGIEMRCIKTEYELLDGITATAELAFALMLATVRKVPAAHNAAMTGFWARDRYRGRQLSGKTLGVLGVGRLGRMMVDYGRGLRMNVIGCDPAPLRPLPDLEYLPFAEFAAQADVVSIHIHLTDENVNFFNAERLAQLKDGVVIVNTSRGRIIDEAALLAALQSGKVGGFGADVIVGEWRDDLAEHPLIAYAREHDNAVIVPHIGGVTHESQAASHEFVVARTAEIIGSW
jgi:D-3-phosphoglycerate dehydrogenase